MHKYLLLLSILAIPACIESEQSQPQGAALCGFAKQDMMTIAEDRESNLFDLMVEGNPDSLLLSPILKVNLELQSPVYIQGLIEPTAEGSFIWHFQHHESVHLRLHMDHPFTLIGEVDGKLISEISLAPTNERGRFLHMEAFKNGGAYVHGAIKGEYLNGPDIRDLEEHWDKLVAKVDEGQTDEDIMLWFHNKTGRHLSATDIPRTKRGSLTITSGNIEFKEELIDCLIRPSCLNQIFISPLSSPSPEIQAKLSEILRTYESSDQWVDYAIRPDGNVVFAEDKPYIKHSILSFISADATRESLRELIQDHQHTGMAGFIHPLSAAGEFKITVVNGKRVIVFNNASGHYRPSPQQTNRYLVRLALQHLVTQALGEQLPIVFVAAKE